GATPMPAETSETARLRCFSNQPVTVTIMGAKTDPAAAPTRMPETTWNSIRRVPRGGSARPAPSSTAPDSTTILGPKRSVSAPQKKPPTPMLMNTSVMASDMPVRDQPVASDIGCRNTASENVEPIATQPNRAPAATTTQPYWSFMVRGLQAYVLNGQNKSSWRGHPVTGPDHTRPPSFLHPAFS